VQRLLAKYYFLVIYSNDNGQEFCGLGEVHCSIRIPRSFGACNVVTSFI